MDKKTQKEVVVEKLKKEGCVDNFWAFHHYILRLGAIIYNLRQNGWEIDGKFGMDSNAKNFIYTLVKEPKVEKKSILKKIFGV